MKLKRLLKNKKGSEVFGMSFSMIFSIILIVFFIAIAGIAINAFLKFQKEAQIRLFMGEFQNAVNIAFNSDEYESYFKSELPSGIKDVCLINLTSSAKSPNTDEQGIFNYVKKETRDFKYNLYIYAPEKSYKTKWGTIKNIDLSQKNPICIPVKNNKVSIKLVREFEYPQVKVSA